MKVAFEPCVRCISDKKPGCKIVRTENGRFCTLLFSVGGVGKVRKMPKRAGLHAKADTSKRLGVQVKMLRRSRQNVKAFQTKRKYVGGKTHLRFPNGAVLLRNRIKHAVIFSYRSPGKSTFTGNNCLTGSCDEGRKKYFFIVYNVFMFRSEGDIFTAYLCKQKGSCEGKFFPFATACKKVRNRFCGG